MPVYEPERLFPADIRLVPPDRRIAETFGWSLGVWGALLAELGLWADFTGKAPSPADRRLFSCAFAVGLALVFWEALRRKRRTVLALYPELPGWVGIYRAGKLSAPRRFGEIRAYFKNESNTVRGLVGLGAFALLFGLVSVMAPAWPDKVMAASVSAGFAASAASFYYARSRCTEFILPRKRWPEAFLASKKDSVHLLRP